MNLSLSLFYKIFDKKYRGLCIFMRLGTNSMRFPTGSADVWTQCNSASHIDMANIALLLLRIGEHEHANALPETALDGALARVEEWHEVEARQLAHARRREGAVRSSVMLKITAPMSSVSSSLRAMSSCIIALAACQITSLSFCSTVMAPRIPLMLMVLTPSAYVPLFHASAHGLRSKPTLPHFTMMRQIPPHAKARKKTRRLATGLS